MALHDEPPWVAVASSAAVRLAAEAGAEVDDILEHADDSPFLVVAGTVNRLEQSAELPEVAADLAGLLWAAECDDVPPIATILEEPAAQAALEAVAESRRQAAARLRATAPPSPGFAHFRSPEGTEVGTREEESTVAAAEAAPPPPAPAPEPLSEPAPPPAPVPSAVARQAPPARRPAAGAVLAGAAAAAILLFGRRLRRA